MPLTIEQLKKASEVAPEWMGAFYNRIAQFVGFVVGFEHKKGMRVCLFSNGVQRYSYAPAMMLMIEAIQREEWVEHVILIPSGKDWTISIASKSKHYEYDEDEDCDVPICDRSILKRKPTMLECVVDAFVEVFDKAKESNE